MKKSTMIILAVAAVALLGLAAKHHQNEDGMPLRAPSSSQAALNSNTQASQGSSTANSTASSAGYKDGTYTGNSEDTPYGTVQVAAVVSGGKITNIEFLQMPGPEGRSRMIASFAEPYLKQETIQSQSSQIEFVSGATTTSEAYVQSLQAALDQAAVS